MNNIKKHNLPILSSEGGLSVYLAQIKKFPMLDSEEEYMLAKNWKQTGNLKSAEKIVTSHFKADTFVERQQFSRPLIFRFFQKLERSFTR